MKINKSNLGRAIKSIRSGLHLTQKHLSEQSGLSINYISLLENGKRGIGIDHLNELAMILGVPAELLIVLASESTDEANEEMTPLLEEIRNIAHQAIDLHLSR